jgi:predicted N-acetyltransferase YhbS
MAMEIRALRPEDDRSQFHSGDEALDRFFHHFAGQNQFRHYLGVTYVAAEEGRILGFLTVAPRHIEIQDLPEPARRRLARYPIPVLGLARLAVDRSAQSRGLGKQLLGFVFRLALRMSGEVGCAGVVVDAKPGAADFYARFGFTPFQPLEGRSEVRPRPQAMWLPIQAVKAAGSNA